MHSYWEQEVDPIPVAAWERDVLQQKQAAPPPGSGIHRAVTPSRYPAGELWGIALSVIKETGPWRSERVRTKKKRRIW